MLHPLEGLHLPEEKHSHLLNMYYHFIGLRLPHKMRQLKNQVHYMWIPVKYAGVQSRSSAEEMLWTIQIYVKCLKLFENYILTIHRKKNIHVHTEKYSNKLIKQKAKTLRLNVKYMNIWSQTYYFFCFPMITTSVCLFSQDHTFYISLSWNKMLFYFPSDSTIYRFLTLRILSTFSDEVNLSPGLYSW